MAARRCRTAADRHWFQRLGFKRYRGQTPPHRYSHCSLRCIATLIPARQWPALSLILIFNRYNAVVDGHVSLSVKSSSLGVSIGDCVIMAGFTPNNTAKRNTAIEMLIARRAIAPSQFPARQVRSRAQNRSRNCKPQLHQLPGIGQRGIETRFDNEKMS